MNGREPTGLGAHDHGEHIFIQMHLVLLLVKFTVLFRLYHRFHPDAEPSQTSISAYSLSASNNRYKQGYSFLQKEMIYVSKERATVEKLVG
jgi:hypothetical protein